MSLIDYTNSMVMDALRGYIGLTGRLDSEDKKFDSMGKLEAQTQQRFVQIGRNILLGRYHRVDLGLDDLDRKLRLQRRILLGQAVSGIAQGELGVVSSDRLLLHLPSFNGSTIIGMRFPQALPLSNHHPRSQAGLVFDQLIYSILFSSPTDGQEVDKDEVYDLTTAAINAQIAYLQL